MMRNQKAVTDKNFLDQALKEGQLKEENLKAVFEGSADIMFIPSEPSGAVLAFYCEGMTDTSQYNEYFNDLLTYITEDCPKNLKSDLPPIRKLTAFAEMMKSVFSGYLLFYKYGDTCFYAVDIAKLPQRTPEESKTEISLKGPRDGFTEDLPVNISLIRKRLKTETLNNETFELGSLSHTKVSLLYLQGKANTKALDEIRSRLEKLETESVTSSGQLEQWLSDRTFSLFPHFDYITRPDFAIECMLRGRFVLVVDGNPSVLIGPTNLFLLIKSPEDVHFPYFIVAFQRLLRIIGLLTAIFLPAAYIAITNVNVDQLPFALLATIVVSREGLPLSLPIEALLILILFELLREAGIRMPTAVGQTISIVGGLIIGDAAIRAGLTSPTLLVVIAVAAVATYTLVNQSLTGTVTILRIYSLLLATYFGVYGFVLSFLSILMYLSQLESFKLSYLEPVVSLNYKEFLAAFLINPFNRKRFTAPMVSKRRK
ncbi:spore germination protein [Alkalihalophilus marmarensis]|uniref:spore germination protein n=1 Tax=Alkalihalophilus marmarensis TaxID=521377 RepID=UPI002DB59FF1|nr:spore germination protein [Alkalihalophilus marmarensis]MEC2074114.1 spore germination protein [Alkalihalophilus marmarensis]